MVIHIQLPSSVAMYSGTLQEIRFKRNTQMKKWRQKNKKHLTLYMREYCRRNKEHINKMQRVHRIKRKYDLSPEQYKKILDFQNGGCGICGKLPKKYHLSVDHDHKTGLLRGILCSPCNRAIGILGDSVESLGKTISYLKSNNVYQVI